MKLIFSTIFLTLSMAAQASVDHKKYEGSIERLNLLKASGQYKLGALVAADLAMKLTEESNFDGMISSIDRTFTTKKKEVITTSERESAGFKIFGLVGGSASNVWDTAKILITNPQEVAASGAIKERDFKKLQRSLKSYLRSHETELFYSKLFSAFALQMASRLPSEELDQVYGTVMRITQLVSNVSFQGFQNILSCERIDYAKRQSGWGIKLTGLISFNMGKTSVEHAHRETQCIDSAIEHSVSELALNSMDLVLADELLAESFKNLQLKKLKESEAPLYPTWGSPYIK